MHALADDQPSRFGADEARRRSGQAEAVIARREDYDEELFGLWLQPRIPFTFKAGQYVTVGIDALERPYSIVSAPYEPLIELFIERIPNEHGGHLTPILHQQRAGDVVMIRPRAKGLFTLRHTTHHVMVATVTGIAPYVSMIRQFLRDTPSAGSGARAKRFYVLHGASYHDEFIYDRELARLSETIPHVIQYVPTVSRPRDARNTTWRGVTGRANEVLEEHLNRWSLPTADTTIYLCGHPGMIDDASTRLAPRGWSIAKEQYWLA
jgi:ferredoxin--NADP+ reductase